MSLPFVDLLQASNHHFEKEDESFLLQWNNHTCSMSNSFADLRNRQDFVDVTLVAGCYEAEENNIEDEDVCQANTRTFGAHKVILSACSPHLKHLLRGLPKWQHPVLVFREVPPEDLEAILTFVYVGKVQVSRPQLKSFLKSAEILRIRGLVQSNQGTDSIFDRASTDEKLSGSCSSLHEGQEPNEDELSLQRQSEISASDSGGSKRPRLLSRPPAKPVTTTITPALLKANKRKNSNNSHSSPTSFGNSVQSSSFGNAVVKNEVAENHNESNFGESGLASTSRDYPDNPARDEDQLVIPNIGLDSSSIEDIGTAQTASTSEGLTDNPLRSCSKSSLCPLCRAVLSNANALSYHMNYLHGITDPQFFNAGGKIIKEDLK